MLLRLSRVTLLAEQPQANVLQDCTALESLQVTAKNSKLLWAGAYIQVVYCERFGGGGGVEELTAYLYMYGIASLPVCAVYHASSTLPHLQY